MKIKFHYTYYILMLIFILCGRFVNLLILTSIILVHELGHYFMARINKLSVKSITIYPYGGLLKLDIRVNTLIIRELLFSVGGIIFQIFYFYLIFIFYRLGLIREYVYNIFNIYNKSILFFNILPIIPLDGFKILSLLMYYFIPYQIVNKLSLIISCILTIFLGVMNYFNGNYSFILIFPIICNYIKEYYDNLNYFFNIFLLERYLYNFYFKRVTCIRHISLMYRDRRHIFKENGSIYSEKVLLNRKFINNR